MVHSGASPSRLNGKWKAFKVTGVLALLVKEERTARLVAAALDYHEAVDLALMTNGGPIEAADTVDGQAYVMVRSDAFAALCAAFAKAEGR